MTNRFPRFLLLAALFLAAAPLSAQHRNRRGKSNDDSNVQRIDTTVTVGHGATVDLSLISGDIKVSSWDRPSVQIKAYSENGDLRFKASSQRVSLSIEDDEDENGDSQFEVIVPKDAKVIGTSISGEVSIRNVAEAEASSISGNVAVTGVAGRATLQTVSGEIIASYLGGPVTAQAVSADVSLTDVSGDLQVTTVSGELKLRGVKSSYVRTQTVSGDLEFDGVIDPKGRYEFHSHSGEFVITVPRGTGATVSMRGFSGELHSTCEMMLMPGNSPGERSYKGMTFTLGGGGARINIETFSGDVEIKGCGGTKSKED